MPELRDEYKIVVNHKVVERLLSTWNLSILRSTHRPRPSGIQRAITAAEGMANLVAQMEEFGLFQVVYTDFTELVYANGQRKAILMPIIGHTSKMAFGWAVGEGDDTPLALRGAKDNPAMESFNGRFKDENHSLLLEAHNLDELVEVVDRRMTYYNTERRHSSIDYLPPVTYIERVRSDSEE